MSLQWTLIATFLYTEVAIVLLLVLPLASPTRWHKLFKSRFFQSLRNQASIYYFILLATLVLCLLDAIREIRKYSNATEHSAEHSHLDTEMQGNMRLFRAQRNFFISGFSLFLSLVIRRLVSLISTQAQLLAQCDALLRQAQSASSSARSLLDQTRPQEISENAQTIGESAQNDSNEAHDKAVSELKSQIKELQNKNTEIENLLTKEKKDKEAIKSQAESLTKEYDRLNDEHAKLLQSSGDKKDN